VFLLAGTLQAYMNKLNLQVLGAVFTIIYCYTLFKYLYRCEKTKARNYSIIIWIISLLLDVVVMVTVNIMGILTYCEEDLLLIKSVGTTFMSIVLLITSNIKPVIYFFNKIELKMEKLQITMNHITTLIISYLLIGYMTSENINNKFTVITLLIIGISVLIITILFISMKYQILNFKKTNEILEKNDIVNRRIITQYRILKHNLESQLIGVKSVSNKEAQALINDLIQEYNASFYIKHHINEMPSGINGLVFEKLYNYHKKELNITITNKIKKNILEEVGPRSYNLFCEALGVTLDNALEASIKSKEKLIYLEFKETDEKLIIKIMNTFTGHIELDKLGTVHYTSKETGHGFGLFSLIGRKNLTITTSIKNNLFINLIEVKKKTDKSRKQ